MLYEDYADDIVKEENFKETYRMIRAFLTQGKSGNERCTIIMGGQPGSGKSNYYAEKDELLNYIVINGDEYRRFHPNYEKILKTDVEHYAERTQAFSNRIAELLISDLSDCGYNLVIEGTLRNADIPIRTCRYLQSKGYEPELVVVACDAEESWTSTISRARLLKVQGLAPRLVPIDIYDDIVNKISNNLETIEREGCFKSISIVARNGNVLYRGNQDMENKAANVLRTELNLDNWNQKKSEYEEAFIKEKIAILQSSLKSFKGRDIGGH